MWFPLKLAQFLAMAQAYNDACDAYWEYRGDNDTNKALRRHAADQRLRYEGWLIGFLDGAGVTDYPNHQELAMRVVRDAFVIKDGE